MSPKKQTVAIKGMNCGSCVRKVEKALNRVKGVNSAEVNFVSQTASVQGAFTEKSIINALKKQGYEGYFTHDMAVATDTSERSVFALLRLIPAFGLGLWLMHLMHQHGMPQAPYGTFWHAINWLSLVLMLLAGFDVYTRFFSSIRYLQPNMYTLVGLGTGAAWVYSCVVLYFPQYVPLQAQHFHYQAGLFVVAFIGLGRFFEAHMRAKAGHAVEKLMALCPKEAIRVRNGQEETVPLDAIEVGDLLRVRSGENIPVDGVLEEGQAMVSEAMITGEPILISKTVGDAAIAGTQNRNGSFLIRAKKVGKATTLATIASMVRHAQATKPAIARIVDQVSGVFTVIVFGLAVGVGTLWWLYGPAPKELYTFSVIMTMFVIACPCALGLATPVSIMVGVGRAAKFGVLFPKGNALQRLGMADVIVFDKTGTLTRGTPRVVDILAVEGYDVERILQLAASLGGQTVHPLSEAVVAEAKHKELNLLKATKIEEKAGLGIKATIGRKAYLLGSQKFLEQEKVAVEAMRHQAQTLVDEGKTIIFIACEGHAIGLLALRDDIRPEATKAVEHLHKQGLKTVILTGDNPIAAQAVANVTQIKEVIANQKPEDKLNYIKQQQKAGNIVAMVGDGINDAPALTQADVGISLASGSDIALSAADVVIATEDLRRLPFAIKVSCATVRNIKQNLFWAFLYNSIALPIAAGLLYPITGQLLPAWVAGAAMALSSLTVVLNALRLSFVKEYKNN